VFVLILPDDFIIVLAAIINDLFGLLALDGNGPAENFNVETIGVLLDVVVELADYRLSG
jgi:hypothetical protein